MRSIVPELTDELRKHFSDPGKVGYFKPYTIKSFREIVEHTAKLSFKNKDHLLFFRGQEYDYINKAGNSTFYPSIYRGDYLPKRELEKLFEILDGASKSLVTLCEKDKIEGYQEIKRRKYIQWSILQHYEVCKTPLLDFTHSLRVACSFASLKSENKYGYVFVFGLPYITNRISTNSEHDLVNIRLLSICPPTALRPYFQEGYLAGTDEITFEFDSKSELDFNNRLIAKFIFPNTDAFWGDGFDKIPEESLYPKNDPIYDLCRQIKVYADKQLRPDEMGDFLKSWAELEEILTSAARKKTKRNVSLREAINLQYGSKIIKKDTLDMLDHLRIFRNKLVHKPDQVAPGQILDYKMILDDMLKLLRSIKENI